MQPKVFNCYSQQRGEKLLKDQTSRNVIKPPKTNNNKDKTQRKKKTTPDQAFLSSSLCV